MNTDNQRKPYSKTIECKACESTAEKCAGHMQLREAIHEPDRDEHGTVIGPPRALLATDRRITQTRGFDLGNKRKGR